MTSFAGIVKLAVFFLLIFASISLSYAQDDSIYRLAAGTRISVKLDVELSSKVASVNDTFLASVAKPVVNRERVVVPVGTVIEGRVTAVGGAAGGSRNGKLEVVFETLKIAGQERRIEGIPVADVTARSSTAFSFLSVLGGVAIGTALGSTTSSSGGRLIGAAIGAGAGTGVALLRKGKEARIRKDEVFEIELKKDVTLPVLDY